MRYLFPLSCLLVISSCDEPSKSITDPIVYPQNVSSLKGFHVATPDIALDATGNIHILYASFINTQSFSVNYSARINDIEWSEPQLLTENEITAGVPNLEFDSKNVGHAVWAGGDQNQTFYSKTDSNGEWITSRVIVDESNSLPQLQIDFHDNLHVIGMGNIYGNYTKYENDDWIMVEDLPFSITNQEFVAKNGKIHLTFETPGSIIAYSNRTLYSPWESMEIVFDGAGYPIGPAVAVDDSGFVYIAWREHFENEILLKKRSKSGEWEWLEALPNPDGIIKDLKMLENHSTLHLFWSASIDGSGFDIFYQSRYSDGSWSIRENLSDSPGDSHTPSIAVFDNQFYIVWREVVDNDEYYSDVFLCIRPFNTKVES